MPSFFDKLRRKSRSRSSSSQTKPDVTPVSTTSTNRLSSASPAAIPHTHVPDATPHNHVSSVVSNKPLPLPTSSVHGPSPASPRFRDDAARASPAKDWNDAGPSRRSSPPLDVDDIPPRTSSLYEREVPLTNKTQSPGVTDRSLETHMREMSVNDPTLRVSVDAPQLPPLQLNSDPIGTAVVPSVAFPATATLPSAGILPIHDPSLPQPASLEQQRDALVKEVAAGAKARKEEFGGLSEEARAVFKAAGMEKEANTASSLEVETRWIKPVVQERIIIKEHTETTTVIEQHIHRHHVYPKIQPIYDPNPIQLERRHRIFSALDGKWHEVVGDAAAIAILGEEAFYNGKKEHRETRQLALPGLGEEAEYAGRVVEREGVQGEMGTWHQVQGLVAEEVQTPGRMIGEGWMLPEEHMGPATKTVGIAL